SRSALLVVVPPPAEAAMPEDKIAAIIEQATQEADENQIRGQQVTPYLLRRINELSNGESLQANLALLKNNARVAAQIANHIHLDSPLKYA
ncbi:MAG: pseudouridine-5'-phosphate glycosidase, partial [Anaerolineae bacterium]|nr:pseudouridine-5'-phosphate glycosidase [Anaerolineae bacterium]